MLQTQGLAQGRRREVVEDRPGWRADGAGLGSQLDFVVGSVLTMHVCLWLSLSLCECVCWSPSLTLSTPTEIWMDHG